MREAKKCVVCGKVYVPKSKSQQCCSPGCAKVKAAESQRKYYKCQYCGKPFWRHDAFRMKYCSNECRQAAAAKQHPKKPPKEPTVYKRDCAYCGKPFETHYPNQIYCCKDCGCSANLKQKREQWAGTFISQKRVCKECGTEFVTECGDTHSVFCCRSCAEKNERRHEHATERHKAYMREAKRVREKQITAAFVEAVSYDAVFARDEGICQICGLPVLYDKFADNNWSGTIDHIVPVSVGGEHSMRNCQLAHRICNSLKCQSGKRYIIDWKEKSKTDNYWRIKYKQYESLMA